MFKVPPAVVVKVAFTVKFPSAVEVPVVLLKVKLLYDDDAPVLIVCPPVSASYCTVPPQAFPVGIGVVLVF